MVIEVSRGSTISGILVAIALLATDYYALTLSNHSTVVLSFQLPVTLALSTAFLGSLGFGYLCGKSYINDDSWKLWMYGISWLIAVSSGVLATLPIDLVICCIFTTSIIIGGFGLAWYYSLTKKVNGDFILLYVLFVNTAINLAYFFLGANI